MNSVFIRKLKMPSDVRAFIRQDTEGDYNIYVNEDLPINLLRPTLMHELTHAVRGHLTDDIKTLKEIEHETHAQA